MGATLEKVDFEGTVIKLSPDGSGAVEFERPHVTGVFTREVLQNPAVAKACTVGAKVTGRAIERNGGFRIVRLEPLN
ncbi:hypothetical protein [Agrobacterium cavarae]